MYSLSRSHLSTCDISISPIRRGESKPFLANESPIHVSRARVVQTLGAVEVTGGV